MKKCPHCNEEIAESAQQCSFCLKQLPLESVKKVGWYHRKSSLIVGFLLVGPLILPAVWTNPNYSSKKKIILTIVVVILTYLLFVSTARALKDTFAIYGQVLKGTL